MLPVRTRIKVLNATLTFILLLGCGLLALLDPGRVRPYMLWLALNRCLSDILAVRATTE